MQASGWFPQAGARITTACCRFRPGTRAIIGAGCCPAACCRAFTIRRKASWPRPTRTSIRPAGRCWSRSRCPTIASGGSTSGWREMTAATLDDMQALQYDVVSLQARDLLAVFLPHMPDGPIKERLAKWDCSYTTDSHEATLFSQLYRNVLLEIFGHEQGIGWRRMMYLCSRVGFSTMVLTAIDKLLLQDDSLWWQRPRQGEPDSPRGRRAGRASKTHPGRAINGFHFTNRFVESRFVGRAFGFHTREMALPGCHATPFQGHLLRAARREASFAPQLSLRHRPGHRRSLDQSARRPQRKPRVGLLQERHPALAQRQIQAAGRRAGRRAVIVGWHWIASGSASRCSTTPVPSVLPRCHPAPLTNPRRRLLCLSHDRLREPKMTPRTAALDASRTRPSARTWTRWSPPGRSARVDRGRYRRTATAAQFFCRCSCSWPPASRRSWPARSIGIRPAILSTNRPAAQIAAPTGQKG